MQVQMVTSGQRLGLEVTGQVTSCDAVENETGQSYIICTFRWDMGFYHLCEYLVC
jgi:hypothetical protein